MLITFPIAIIFEICFPILLGIWFVRRYRSSWKLVGIGALVFVGAQVLHIPFLSWLTSLFTAGTLPAPGAAYRVLFNAVLLGLLAGLFEETARAIAFYFLKDQARSWKPAVALGIGHGGIESILLVGLPVLATFAAMLVWRAQGVQNLDPLTAQQVTTYFATSWDLPLAGRWSAPRPS